VTGETRQRARGEVHVSGREKKEKKSAAPRDARRAKEEKTE
jgi:hypothetical protein